jgi:hypothetical protein
MRIESLSGCRGRLNASFRVAVALVVLQSSLGAVCVALPFSELCASPSVAAIFHGTAFTVVVGFADEALPCSAVGPLPAADRSFEMRKSLRA